MNLLCVTNIVDRSEESLIKWLAEKGHNVTVFCNPDETAVSEYEKRGIHVIPKVVRNRLDFKLAPLIRNLCKYKPIDTLYSNFNAGLSISLMATLGLPTRVVAYRGTLGNLSWYDPSSYLTHLSPRLNGIIANCDSVRDFLVTLGISSNKVKTIIKGFNKEWYDQSPKLSPNKLGISGEEIIIGMIANLRPLKGTEYLLQAIKELATKYPITLLLIGSHNKTGIEERIQELNLTDTVKLLGYRSDAAEIASFFDIAVLPSTRREGVARSIVEAISHGKPCIVTNVGGLPTMVEDGVNGFIVPPKDAKSLKNALEKLILDKELRERFGRASSEIFKQKFDLNRYHTEMMGFLAGSHPNQL